MEGIEDLPLGGKHQLIHHRPYHFGDGEGSVSPRGQLGGGVEEFQVRPFQPDPVANLVTLEGSPFSASFVPHEYQLLSMSDGLVRLLVQEFQVPRALRDCRHYPLASCDLDGRSETDQELEWSETRRGAWPGVVHILGDGQPLSPVVLLAVAVNAEVLFEPLIGALRLPVCLRVIGRADVLGDIQNAAHFLGEM